MELGLLLHVLPANFADKTTLQILRLFLAPVLSTKLNFIDVKHLQNQYVVYMLIYIQCDLKSNWWCVS